jgi:hypothetical protein
MSSIPNADNDPCIFGINEGVLASPPMASSTEAVASEWQSAEASNAEAEADSASSAGPTTAPDPIHDHDLAIGEDSNINDHGDNPGGLTDDNTLITADVVVDPTIAINDATVFVEDDEDEGEVIIGTPILPCWKQRLGQALIGTTLVVLVALATAIGLLVSDNPPSVEEAAVDTIVPVGKGGPHGTCPSDESAMDCGATLEIWMDVVGWSILNLVIATNNFTLPPNRTERLINTLSGPFNSADNYGCRIHGWLVPPITSDEYVLVVTADDEGELWLSADEDPNNKVLVAGINNRGGGLNPQSSPISFVAGRAYYFEVRGNDEKRHMQHLKDTLRVCVYIRFCATSHTITLIFLHGLFVCLPLRL